VDRVSDALKLTTYFGERDRTDGRLLADALIDLYATHDVAASALFRGIEGFGIRHRLQTARLLTLSEDLPIVSVAVDARERIEALLPEVERISGHGLITLERAALRSDLPDAEAVKLTVYLGRRQGVREVVRVLHGHGVAGATALLGVDGTVHGERRRARFFGTNADVPVMVISVGEAARIAAALPALREHPLTTLERVRVCKRDGRRLADLPTVDGEPGLWQKVMVYASEQAHVDGGPLYSVLIRRLREAGAAGATVLRGFWGYHGDHAPHGDRFWALRRHVPVVCALVDRPEAMRQWYAIVDEVTAETGLVTAELVPALRATGPGIEHGGGLSLS
jgi:PII-like signaling protein